MDRTGHRALIWLLALGLGVSAPVVAQGPPAPTGSAVAAKDEGWVLFQVGDVRRCAGYGDGVYLLARRFTIYNYRPRPRGRDWAEMVQSEAGVQYGLTRAYRARLVRRATSEESPASVRDGRYLLALSTTNTFCARSYSVGPADQRGFRQVRYTDCDTGAECKVPYSTRRPFQIDEFEAGGENVLAALWRSQQADPARRQPTE